MEFTEAERRRMEAWRIAGPMLEQEKAERLRTMTEEEGRQSAERVMEAVPEWDGDTARQDSSGLLEQQRWFAKARGC
ncbi:MAG: hypothetical protein H0V56_13820 [Chthoniobacterales bacterium]|nr:hypothetical protein [Chthoniobacterales bacterium]